MSGVFDGEGEEKARVKNHVVPLRAPTSACLPRTVWTAVQTVYECCFVRDAHQGRIFTVRLDVLLEITGTTPLTFFSFSLRISALTACHLLLNAYVPKRTAS